MRAFYDPWPRGLGLKHDYLVQQYCNIALFLHTQFSTDYSFKIYHKSWQNDIKLRPSIVSDSVRGVSIILTILQGEMFQMSLNPNLQKW